MVADLGAVLV